MPATETITRRSCLPRGVVFRAAATGLAAASAAHALQAQDGSIAIYFYSPETNVNNFSVLKGEFDTLLAEHGGHKFQPFSDRNTFEKQIEAQPRGLFLLSSWHFQQLASKVALDPFLVGVSKDKVTQKHLLFGKAATALADLRGQRVATAGTRDYTLTLLRLMLGDSQADLVNSLNILVVPKDIDALLAVGFGAARGAVATENGADKLAKLNPKQRDVLKELAPGRESLLPILAAPKNMDTAVRQLVQVFATMGQSEQGKLRLQLLGLEAMRELDAGQKAKLR